MWEAEPSEVRAAAQVPVQAEEPPAGVPVPARKPASVPEQAAPGAGPEVPERAEEQELIPDLPLSFEARLRALCISYNTNPWKPS